MSVAPLIERFGGRFADLIETAPSLEALSALRAAETIGRPVGSSAFLDRLAAATGRDPRPGRRGPRPKGKGEGSGLSKVSPFRRTVSPFLVLSKGHRFPGSARLRKIDNFLPSRLRLDIVVFRNQEQARLWLPVGDARPGLRQ